MSKKSKPTNSLLVVMLLAAAFCQSWLAHPRSVLGMQFVESAKKEKKLVVYATMDLPQIVLVISDFLQRSPLFDIELYPFETETLVKKIQEEALSGRRSWDVLLAGGGVLQPLIDQKLLASYHSPQKVAISDDLIHSQGYWSGYYINPLVLGYNTTLVKDEDIPRTYEQLLDRRWKGNRIAIDSTAHGLLRGLAATWGEDKAVLYLKRLARQQPVLARASIAAVEYTRSGNASLVIARAPVIEGHEEKLHSPLQWVFLSPVVAQIDAVMLSAQSPHPVAFVDFVLSKEGQSILAGIQQIPVRRDMQAASKYVLPGHQWFVERPDKHVGFQKTVALFREIFGIQ